MGVVSLNYLLLWHLLLNRGVQVLFSKLSNRGTKKIQFSVQTLNIGNNNKNCPQEITRYCSSLLLTVYLIVLKLSSFLENNFNSKLINLLNTILVLNRIQDCSADH